MNRRTFFQRTIGGIVAAALAPFLTKVQLSNIPGPQWHNGTVAQIDRATYLWWQKHQTTHEPATLQAIDRKIIDAFNECRSAHV